jgi:hypothetical protein
MVTVAAISAILASISAHNRVFTASYTTSHLMHDNCSPGTLAANSSEMIIFCMGCYFFDSQRENNTDF